MEKLNGNSNIWQDDSSEFEPEGNRLVITKFKIDENGEAIDVETGLPVFGKTNLLGHLLSQYPHAVILNEWNISDSVH